MVAQDVAKVCREARLKCRVLKHLELLTLYLLDKFTFSLFCVASILDVARSQELGLRLAGDATRSQPVLVCGRWARSGLTPAK